MDIKDAKDGDHRWNLISHANSVFFFAGLQWNSRKPHGGDTHGSCRVGTVDICRYSDVTSVDFRLSMDHLAGEVHEKEAGQFEWFGVSSHPVVEGAIKMIKGACQGYPYSQDIFPTNIHKK